MKLLEFGLTMTFIAGIVLFVQGTHQGDFYMQFLGSFLFGLWASFVTQAAFDCLMKE